MEDQTVEQAMALPCWQDPQNPRRLDGGITNVNLLITDQDRDYVVRMGSDIPEHGVMRFNELAISRAAHSTGISPEVHYAEQGFMVLDYVDAAPLTEEDVQDPDTLLQVVELLGRVHRDVKNHLRGPILSFWVFHILRDYAGQLRSRNSGYIDLLPELMKQSDALEASVGSVDLVLGHNDLLPANILRGSDRLWLIDWEYGGFNSPLFDLGGLAANCSLDESAEQMMLTAYYGKTPDATMLKKYTAMKCASLLRETMWSMVSEITSKIEFDYREYTQENLGRYQQAFVKYLSVGEGN